MSVYNKVYHCTDDEEDYIEVFYTSNFTTLNISTWVEDDFYTDGAVMLSIEDLTSLIATLKEAKDRRVT